MTINFNIDRRIRSYLLSRLPENNNLDFSVPVEDIIKAVPGVRPSEVVEQIRHLYVGVWWFSTDHGEPVAEETVTRRSIIRPTKGWTLDELRDALEKPPIMSERKQPPDAREYRRRQERW